MDNRHAMADEALKRLRGELDQFVGQITIMGKTLDTVQAKLVSQIEAAFITVDAAAGSLHTNMGKIAQTSQPTPPQPHTAAERAADINMTQQHLVVNQKNEN